jgi:hypothetical protein
MDSQLVKLWIKDQISKINYKKEMGFIPSEIADAKVETLMDFYETFNLDQVTTKVTYHAKV